MEICLNGCENNEKIEMKICEVLGFPEERSYEGGYDIICELAIDIGCYHIKFERLFSATGALFRFGRELKHCYDMLEGEAEYKLLLENDFTFKVKMTEGGHAVVCGHFQERPDKSNAFYFEMKTDQTCLYPVIQKVDLFKELYGEMQENK